jgi:hypothetical protein
MGATTSTAHAPAASDPGAEYARRLAQRRAEQERLSARHARLTRARNVLVGLLVALAVLTEHERPVAKLLLLAPPAVLLEWLVRRRTRSMAAWQRAERAAGFYEQRLACVEERWAGTGQPGTHYLDEGHPCADDLDLFGTGGLFERLCTARTRPGEDTLAAWLLAPAAPDEVRARQLAVAELRDALDLREDLALLAGAVPANEDLKALADWAAAPPVLTSPPARWAARLLPALTAAGLLGWLFLRVSPAWMLSAFLLQGALTLILRGRLREVLGPVEGKMHDLRGLVAVFERIERESFNADRLKGLRARLTEGVPASRRVARLHRLLSLVLGAYFLLLRPQWALALEAWRRTSGSAFARWLAALGEFEALGSLAAYAFENPDDPFPEVVDEGPCLEGKGLGHPLIPKDRCVRNDLALGAEVRVLVVSGSNMSGKSTLLRTAGVNAVLALAGAPVRARRLRVSRLVVGATLRIEDSLQAGRSRFYAEVLRVRQLLDLAQGPIPLLFLLDEVFQGTNSSDRRVGAEAVIRKLVEAGAVGLVTTHDLALTEIADHLAPRAANVHFDDSFEGGVLAFDYRMKPGVVRTSNGLAIMRAVGIEV